MNLNTHTTHEGKKFYYVDMGSEAHGRKSFRLWVNKKLVSFKDNGDPFVNFPAQAILGKGKKDWILKPSSEHVTFDIYVSCGYRGTGTFEILTPHETIAYYRIFRSTVGSLGVSNGALVTIQTSNLPLKYKWKRTGRLYGASSEGTTVLKEDGTRFELYEDLELLEMLE